MTCPETPASAGSISTHKQSPLPLSRNGTQRLFHQSGFTEGSLLTSRSSKSPSSDSRAIPFDQSAISEHVINLQPSISPSHFREFFWPLWISSDALRSAGTGMPRLLSS